MPPLLSRAIAFDPTDAHDHRDPDHPIQRWQQHVDARRIGAPAPIDPAEAANLARTAAVLRASDARVRA